MREELFKQLEVQEKYRRFPYLDSLGILTIGIGRNLVTRGISREESLYLLGNDIEDADSQLRSSLPWYKNLDSSVRQDVLINMTINMGIKSVLGFKRALDAMRRQDWTSARMEMLNSLWRKQVGQRAEELANQIESGKRKDVL